jgi:hypothetical protein
LLLPLFIPGALTGLLWRPYLAPWLSLADADLSLILIAIVTLWITIPLAAWLFSRQRRAWLTLIPLTALLILLNGDFILTFTRGEPFNATHTWSSWIIAQLWINRAWDYAVSMAIPLAFVLALMIAWAIWSIRAKSESNAISYGSPLGLIIVLIWLLAPFVMPTIAFFQSPIAALNALIELGALRWLLNGTLVWITVTLLEFLIISMLPALAPPPRAFALAAGWAILLIAHTFPIQLLLNLPSQAWTPALGVVLNLAGVPHSNPTLGAALLLAGIWAGLGAWLITLAYGEEG